MSSTPNDSLSPDQYTQQNPLPFGTASTSGYTGVSSGYIPPNQRDNKQQGAKYGVVSPDGAVEDFYDLRTRPGEILGSLDDVSRIKLVNTLYSRGWYGGKKKEGGFGDNDINAVQNLLYYANVRGVSWDTILNTVSQAPISTGTGGAGPTVANTSDLVEIAQRTALSTIGRKLNDTEAAKFAAAYQGTQRSSAYSTMSAPSADVYFQNRIQNQYGAETDEYKYLTAISNVSKLMENM